MDNYAGLALPTTHARTHGRPYGLLPDQAQLVERKVKSHRIPARRALSLAGAIFLLATAPARAVTFGPNLDATVATYLHDCAEAGGNNGCTVRDPLEEDMELVLPDPVVNGDQTAPILANALQTHRILSIAATNSAGLRSNVASLAFMIVR